VFWRSKQNGGQRQPWFYLRLALLGAAAYSFLGLSEGAYGGP